ncbi:unnamed protein product [Citrullus colocynthis]|uniref:Uncharacterized protein n=1 Tax=Citrullus colocynthis TaxID=252529 RepID=A0ABP0YJG4_9ROSI
MEIEKGCMVEESASNNRALRTFMILLLSPIDPTQVALNRTINGSSPLDNQDHKSNDQFVMKVAEYNNDISVPFLFFAQCQCNFLIAVVFLLKLRGKNKAGAK